MKNFIGLIALVSLPSFACEFAKMGSMQCYKALDKKEKSIELILKKIYIDDMDAGLQVAIKSEKGKFTRTYTMGKKARTFTDNDRNDIMDYVDFTGDEVTDFYEKNVKCTKDEITIIRKYFYANGMDYYASDGDYKEVIKIVAGSYIELDQKMTDIGKNGTTYEAFSRKAYCFWR